MAVRKMTAGYKAIFDQQGNGALTKLTQSWIPMDEEEDACFLDLWVNTDDQMKEPKAGLPRQE